MTPLIDLVPTTRHVAAVATAVTDDQLTAPTPCLGWTVADLIGHLDGLSLAFTGAASKAPDPVPDGPTIDGSVLDPAWRDQLEKRLIALGEAWRDPAAWAGRVAVGGLEMPADEAALVALDEVVVHGWDLARATGQSYPTDPAALAPVYGFVQAMSEPGVDRGGLFGPVVAVSDDASLIERIVGLAGRDPAWTSPA